MAQYNVNNPAVKRILREVKEMEAEPSDQYHANPLEDNIFEWHFTIRGPKDTEFEGGLYHGRIILPPEYPFKPPNIVLLNESGRFEVGTKICLSISSYHPEHWQPSWTIKTMLVALISFLPSKGDGAIGAIDMAAKERRVLAQKTPDFVCNKCNKRMSDILEPVEIGAKSETAQEPSTTTTTSTEPAPINDTTSTTTTTTTTTTTPTASSSAASNANDFNEAPIFAPQPTQSITPTIAPPMSFPQSNQAQAITHAPPISHSQPQPQPSTAQPQPSALRPTQPTAQPLRFVQQTQQVQQVQSPSGGNLDYIIVTVLIALVALLVKKFYGL